MNKGVIYYTSNDIDPTLFRRVQQRILESGLPITSCSLKPIDFGDNYVLEADKGIVTYFRQIVLALQMSQADYVFFCEHDILYNQSHFDFEPERDDTFYYNTNVWKWDYGTDRVVAYDHQASVSGMCVNRKLALAFYQRRMEIILGNGWDRLPTHGNPTWARNLGYEPGRHRGNRLEPARAEEWASERPIIDIRHSKNMTPQKMHIEGFKKKPTGWRESVIDKVI